jgi:hypothetical protein
MDYIEAKHRIIRMLPDTFLQNHKIMNTITMYGMATERGAIEAWNRRKNNG